MTEAQPEASAPLPQARVLRNRARLLEAAAEAAAQAGWSGLAFSQVASRSGLSTRALRDRFADVPALAAALWSERCGPLLGENLGLVLQAGGLMEETPSRSALTDALNTFLHPDEELRAVGELLIVASFDSTLREAVEQTNGRQVSAWCTPRGSSLPKEQAARRAYLTALAVGLLIAGRRPGIEDLSMESQSGPLLDALQADVAATSLPKVRATHLDRSPTFDTGDPALDALLRSTLQVVGSNGFDRSTLSHISSAVGLSEGAIFNRYQTKLELFVDAVTRQNNHALRANEEWTRDLADRFGPGIAWAITIREFTRPEHAKLRAIQLEQVRVSWHHEELRTANAAELEEFEKAAYLANSRRSDRERTRAHFHASLALGLGTSALALLHAGCWKLPFDVMTVPLTEEQH